MKGSSMARSQTEKQKKLFDALEASKKLIVNASPIT